MTTSNTGSTAAKAGADKGHEKLAEKRRALGRGLESLLPGPRVVPATPKRQDSSQSQSGGPAVAADVPLRQSVSGESGSTGDESSLAVRAETPVAPLGTQSFEPTSAGQTPSAKTSADGEPVIILPIEQINENPFQTRRYFDQEALKDLASSIQVQGVLQPVVVRPSKEGGYILILGERRLRASRMAGKSTLPAIVKRVSEQQAAEMTLVENLQRQDLNCVEQAEGFAKLSQRFNLTQEEIGKRSGISREQVSNYMRLLSLPEGVIGALQTGTLTYSHARTLLSLKDHAQIWKIARKAIDEKMSVAKLEQLVFGVTAPLDELHKPGGGARWVDPNVEAAQRSIEQVLGMKVRIRDRAGKGKIVIEYGTLDDFDRLITMLKGK